MTNDVDEAHGRCPVGNVDRSGKYPRDAARGLEFVSFQEHCCMPTNASAPIWFHVILTTYGAWLPGDPRGFRTRHHRDHVEGDYTNPPPAGIYERFAEKNRAALKHDEVSLDRAQRETVGKALKAKLDELGVLLIAIAASAQHIHLLLKVRPNKVRTQVGAAKRHAWFELRESGWKKKLWGRRGKFLRIRDRAHQLNVFRYILRHAEQRAWVWYYSPAKDTDAPG